MQEKKKTLLIFTTSILILMVIVLTASLINFIISKTTYYKISPRVKNMEKYSENNKNMPAIGWIRVQGTNIDYPIVYSQTTDVFFEMTEDFTWSITNATKLVNRVYIFGHNILNISSNPIIADKNHHRFEQLPSFMYTDFAKENKYIQYTVDGKDYLYKIFSVSIVEDYNLYHESVEYSKEDLKKYINQSLSDSFYDYDIDVDENDKIITLATCTRFFGATSKYTYKVDARMVRDNEKITNYSLKENKNYKVIKDKMNEAKKGEMENVNDL